MTGNTKRSLRVVTYNIHRCIGYNGVADPDKIAEVLTRLNPDIVALQEVVSTQDQDGGMLGYLAKQTGLHALPGLTMLEGEGHYGNAMLSRAVAENIKRYDISVAGREPRGVLSAEFRFGQQKITVFTTHLGLKTRERSYQIHQLLNYLSHTEDRACLVMGDFNEWNLLGGNLRLLNNYFKMSHFLATFPSRFPVFPFDKIWVTSPCVIESTRVVNDHLARSASDHLPLFAQISFG